MRSDILILILHTMFDTLLKVSCTLFDILWRPVQKQQHDVLHANFPHLLAAVVFQVVEEARNDTSA
jgi:hypothetical protein